MLTQYGTYVVFSWDIIEPITCLMGFSDAVLGYLFWLRTGKPWDIAGLGAHFERKKFLKELKKSKMDVNKFETTKRAIALLEGRLAGLKNN